MRKINKELVSNKDIISVEERERQVLSSVPEFHEENLEKLVQDYRDISLEKLPKGVPPSQEVQHQIKAEPGSKPLYRPPYRLGPVE